MMARSSNAPSIGRIQKRKTNFSNHHFSACNARPVHTEGPLSDIAQTSHHSMTSSARPSSGSGTVRPSAFAAFI